MRPLDELLAALRTDAANTNNPTGPNALSLNISEAADAIQSLLDVTEIITRVESLKAAVTAHNAECAALCNERKKEVGTKCTATKCTDCPKRSGLSMVTKVL